MEQFNHFLFSLINATPHSPEWAIAFATFVARDLINIIPLLMVGLWLWGSTEQMTLQRQAVSKTAIALVFAMLSAACIGMLFPHNRPFVEGFGYNFLPHAPDSSFPSDHGTAIFTFALAFLCWHRVWSGVTLLIIGLAIAWSRVYLGVHWPLDMVGAFLVAIVGCLFSQLLWNLFGENISTGLTHLYHRCFSFPISKGWVKS
ncbi:undecaprenyl-diphosphate phosphatase [Yersinia ruckeri]|uniref:undecaprenyl-diphosphate phosphatase n=1 Tax=Yersinia ruckeri TaxID=29486 RepID=A0A085U9Q6_YERRU|nr:undecaprenyl-diphosphate phosphatase [Yersinia ruckeri]AKA39784.1 UDP-diphosphatase [Yersinia ruckeri]ARZ01517.1 undecaprenyl pyrophosphate phosphatase [Yersinia ruckeri]EEQ00747.1 Undecaprenyl-diphosphatase [Yersinia ruckeri ATCC 29473]EKN3345190.1 undecaprenyl-diphosphate phosphatase [Yersinia ruckeri]EKN3360609.1 undecaprenyl-diphosphate phosphatase [Yersinia ruckeri]